MLAVTFCEIGWLNVSVKPCVFCSSVIFCERKIVGYSQWGVLSLTERTEFTEPFGAPFESTERLRHAENTEAFQLTLAVTLCDIGWLNVSVKVCVFCSSVIFCERKIVGYSQWGVFSLTERTEFTEPFGAHFEPTERLRHTENTEAFQLTLAVTLCDIGWLNVSVKVCVFCSSV